MDAMSSYFATQKNTPKGALELLAHLSELGLYLELHGSTVCDVH